MTCDLDQRRAQAAESIRKGYAIALGLVQPKPMADKRREVAAIERVRAPAAVSGDAGEPALEAKQG